MSEAKNEDKLIYEYSEDYYSDKIYVTKNRWITIDVGGHCISMPLREWHRMAKERDNEEEMEEILHRLIENRERKEELMLSLKRLLK